MPRARNIKPGFFTNDELVELPMATRLLFIGLWTLADREGRLEDRPKKIKMELFPADDVDVDEALSTLVSSAFIQRYRVGDAGYIQVRNFAKHQRPHSNESASTFPPPETATPPTPPEKPRQSRENENTANHGEQDGAPWQPSRAGAGAIKTDTGYLNADSLIPDTGFPADPNTPAAPAEEVAAVMVPTDHPPQPIQPFDLLEALVETLGQDISVLSPSEKSKQLGVAKRLLTDGMTDADVRDMAKWLRAQTWMTSGIDFLTLERYRGRWQMSGKPKTVPDGSLRLYNGGNNTPGRDGRTDAERGYRLDPGPKGWSADELARMSMDDYRTERSGT